ncbi:MAG: Xaa-Pro peptidase family protein [Lactobacillus equicursoris]|uniref:M24 family metallopeptidase n=1 Tax=Lactobacillus equicursoris TaxID=420645 RepID=UPI00242CD659|nr:Xaa-Pro peptidase family protein [Lactobacillus equicursoris]MDD6407160.1 Xaa-Pro peptidase family protein [Lactobacillus equicursoris]
MGEFRDSLKKLLAWLKEERIDLAYVADPTSIAYLTGYASWTEERVMALLVSREEAALLFAPAINEGELRSFAWPGAVAFYQDGESPWKKIKEAIAAWPAQTWALEGGSLSLAWYRALQAEFPGSEMEADITDFLKKARLRKSPEEVAKLQAAGAQADLAIEIGIAALRSGVSEGELAAEIQYQLRAEPSFPTIVQIGENAANVSALPGEGRLAPGDMVIFDLGTMKNGYASDVSRTVGYGEVSAEQRQIYETVRQAQQAAADGARPGMTAGEVDELARRVIREAGYGQYFPHRLGHGIGMQVHEAPGIQPGSNTVLEAGMCFSIEPGIYVPGVAGVRIEDCGVLTEKGFEPFTHFSKELQILPIKK